MYVLSLHPHLNFLVGVPKLQYEGAVLLKSVHLAQTAASLLTTNFQIDPKSNHFCAFFISCIQMLLTHLLSLYSQPIVPHTSVTNTIV